MCRLSIVYRFDASCIFTSLYSVLHSHTSRDRETTYSIFPFSVPFFSILCAVFSLFVCCSARRLTTFWYAQTHTACSRSVRMCKLCSNQTNCNEKRPKLISPLLSIKITQKLFSTITMIFHTFTKQKMKTLDNNKPKIKTL